MGLRSNACAVVLVLAAIATAAGCGSETVALDPATGAGPSSPPSKIRPAPVGVAAGRPPALVVSGDGGAVSVHATSYCWNNGCSDGAAIPPSDLPHVTGDSLPFALGSRMDVYVELRSLDRGCTSSAGSWLTTDGEGRGTVEPHGAAGRYWVSLTGDPPSGGDASYDFVWNATAAGQHVAPTAQMGLLDAHADDGALMIDGLDVMITGIRAADLTDMTATLIAADGHAITLPTPARSSDEERPGCPPAALDYQGDAGVDLATVQALGRAPYTYRVTLTIDGKPYVGTGVWPRDENQHDHPYVPLTFEPPLPTPLA